MHSLLAKTKFSRFHGTNTEWDFVEAPSQMLENWCWQPEILKKLSSHYEDSNKKLPEDLIDSLVKSKNVLAGLLNLRQIFFATFDLTIHERDEKFDTTELWHKLRSEISLIPSAKETFGAATFGHIMGGYDMGYYGYLWSQVFSADMFYSRFKTEGIMNEKTGMDYRNEILGVGGSRDGMDSLKAFLKREPNNQAFLKSLGIA